MNVFEYSYVKYDTIFYVSFFNMTEIQDGRHFKSKSNDAHKISSFEDIKFISVAKCMFLKATKSNKERAFHLTFSIMADIQNGCHFLHRKSGKLL